MKKLNALLHEVTLIDFRYLAIIILRYKRLMYAFPVVAFILLTYFYANQSTIYRQRSDFKVEERSSLASMGPFSSMAGESNELFTSEEVLRLSISYDFNSRLVTEFLKLPAIDKLIVSGPTSNDEVSVVDVIKDCHQLSCKHAKLVEYISTLYSFQSTSINNRYELAVTTKSEETTRVLTNLIVKTLEDYRSDILKASIKRQIDSTQGLLVKAQKEVETNGGYKYLQDESVLKQNIGETQDKLRSLIFSLNAEKAILTSLTTKKKQTIEAIDKNETAYFTESKSEKLSYERMANLQAKQKELRGNLNLLLNQKSELSSTEGAIAKQIENELTDIEREIKGKRGLKRKIAFDDKFIKNQQNSESSIAFDHEVQEDKVRVISKEVDTLRKYLDQLLAEKLEREKSVITATSEMQYLTQLESRLMSLKMNMASITSDVLFDVPDPTITSLKRASFIKVTLFSFLFCAFLYFIVLVAFYLYDDRLYDEKEIESLLGEVKILGKVPVFNKD